MSTIMTAIAKKYTVRAKITKERYDDAVKTLPPDELSKRFETDYDTYTEIFPTPTDPAELSVVLLDELIDEQKKATYRLGIIVGIMIACLTISAIAAIIIIRL